MRPGKPEPDANGSIREPGIQAAGECGQVDGAFGFLIDEDFDPLRILVEEHGVVVPSAVVGQLGGKTGRSIDRAVVETDIASAVAADENREVAGIGDRSGYGAGGNVHAVAGRHRIELDHVLAPESVRHAVIHTAAGLREAGGTARAARTGVRRHTIHQAGRPCSVSRKTELSDPCAH